MFPTIRHIDDVLPHIEGNESFFVKDLGYCKVINYRSMIDAFGNVLDHGEMIRRECRGLKFFPDGRIMSRVLQKFFNLNERPETRHENLPWKCAHIVETKWDGSMIHPGYGDEGQIVFMTKMGRTETALVAERAFLTEELASMLAWMLVDGKTPIFEFCAPWNRIVVGYEEPKLVLLATRNTVTGEYVCNHPLLDSKLEDFGVTLPIPKQGRGDGFNLDEVRSRVGEEGVVLVWSDGHRVKVKSDWYVLLHKAKDDLVSSPKSRVKLILEDAVDDALPLLEPAEQETIKALRVRVYDALQAWGGRIASTVLCHMDDDQKTFATSQRMTALGNTHPMLKAMAFTLRKELPLLGRGLEFSRAKELLVEGMKDQCATTAKAEALELAVKDANIVRIK